MLLFITKEWTLMKQNISEKIKLFHFCVRSNKNKNLKKRLIFQTSRKKSQKLQFITTKTAKWNKLGENDLTVSVANFHAFWSQSITLTSKATTRVNCWPWQQFQDSITFTRRNSFLHIEAEKKWLRHIFDTFRLNKCLNKYWNENEICYIFLPENKYP